VNSKCTAEKKSEAKRMFIGAGFGEKGRRLERHFRRTEGHGDDHILKKKLIITARTEV